MAISPAVIVTANGVTKDTLTLDIPEPQVLVQMTGIPQNYEHHILMEWIEPGVWVTVDSAGRKQVEEIDDHAIHEADQC